MDATSDSIPPPGTGLSRLQWAAARAIREGNTFLIVSEVFQNAGSTLQFIEPSHRFVADEYAALRDAIRGIAERQQRQGLGPGGLVVLSGHSIALAALYLEHPQKGSVEWVTLGRLARDLYRDARHVGWVLLNLCFPTSVLESRRSVPERLVGREGVGYHAQAPAGGPRFVAPAVFGSIIYGRSVLQGGKQPVTEPLIEMLSGRATVRAFVPPITREQALRIVKGDDRLYERLDLSDSAQVTYSRDGTTRSISIYSSPRDVDEFRLFSGSPGVRTGCREYLLAARTLEKAGVADEATRLRAVFREGASAREPSIPADYRVAQARILEDLSAAVASLPPLEREVSPARNTPGIKLDGTSSGGVHLLGAGERNKTLASTMSSARGHRPSKLVAACRSR